TSRTITLAQFTAAGGATSDACGGLTYSYIDTQTSSCPIVVTRVFTVTHACFNTANCTQLININDTQRPVINSCPDDQLIEGCGVTAITGLPYSEVSSSITGAQFTAEGGDAYDLCGITSYSYIDTRSGTCPLVVTRTFTLGDA